MYARCELAVTVRRSHISGSGEGVVTACGEIMRSERHVMINLF